MGFKRSGAYALYKTRGSPCKKALKAAKALYKGMRKAKRAYRKKKRLIAAYTYKAAMLDYLKGWLLMRKAFKKKKLVWIDGREYAGIQCSSSTNATKTFSKVTLPWGFRIGVVKLGHLIKHNRRGVSWVDIFDKSKCRWFELSHLCHLDYCQTSAHSVVEPTHINIGRGYCPGPRSPSGCTCLTNIKCIRAGNRREKMANLQPLTGYSEQFIGALTENGLTNGAPCDSNPRELWDLFH